MKSQEERRAAQREASRRYRAKLTAEQKLAKRQRQTIRKREMLKSFSAEEKEKWRLRQREYDRKYEASLGPEALQKRRHKQHMATKALREKEECKATENLESDDKTKRFHASALLALKKETRLHPPSPNTTRQTEPDITTKNGDDR